MAKIVKFEARKCGLCLGRITADIKDITLFHYEQVYNAYIQGQDFPIDYETYQALHALKVENNEVVGI